MLNKQQRFIVDLDTLVDTRLGTVKRYWDSKITEDTLAAYHERDHVRVWDIFGIPEDEYKEAYANRDMETLQSSFSTQLSNVIRALLTTSIFKADTNPHISQIEVTLNVHRYKDEMDEVVLGAFLNVLNELLLVDEISTSKKVVTRVGVIDINNMSAGDLRKEYEGMIIPDLVEWLEHTNKLTAKEPAPTFTVYYPALLTDDDEESRRQITEDNVNPFKTVRVELARHFLAEGLDVELFNIVKA